MTLIENILLEMGFAGSVSVSDITNAVTHMLSANITYDDGKPGNGKSIRHISPVAYGLSTAGNPVIRAFQDGGSTRSVVPHWKLFDVTKISSWDTIEGEKYDPSKLVGFNKDGDKQMEIIYSIAPIGNAKNIEVAKGKNMPTNISSTPVKKIDVLRTDNDSGDSYVDNEHYTADNAINDVLKSANLSNIVKKVDNLDKSNYNSNVNKDETKPIRVSDIPGGDNDVESEVDKSEIEQPKMAITNDPIKKDDLKDKQESIKSSFNDMMNRMNNLNKNDNELNRENGN